MKSRFWRAIPIEILDWTRFVYDCLRKHVFSYSSESIALADDKATPCGSNVNSIICFE